MMNKRIGILRASIIGIIILCSYTSVQAQTSRTVAPPIEKLVYLGYYNWGFIWIKAGQVEFTQSDSKKYPNAQYLQASGRSLPSWDDFFKLRDTLTSHFDNTTFIPYEFTRVAHEGKYNRSYKHIFDYQDSTLYSTIIKPGSWVKHDTLQIVPNLYDMLSIAWYARTLDYSKYIVGEKIPIKIFIDDEICNLYIRYLGKDKLKIAGEKRECYIFSPLLVSGEVFKGGENMKIWLSADDKRIPLMVESKIIVGSVKGVLVPQESKY